MATGDSDRLQQVLCRAEPDFANLSAAVNGTPNGSGLHTPGSDPTSGVTFANPEFTAEYDTAENEEVRNRPFRNTPTLLTRAGTVAGDIYVRGNGADDAEVFTDRVFTALDAFFGIKSTHAVEHDVLAFDTVTQLTITGAFAAGLRAGMGFHIILPTGKSFVAFVSSVAQTGPPDVITFDPPMTAAELTACQAEAGDSIKLRGGRTYAVGDEYLDGTSIYWLLLKQAYAQEVFGSQGATIEANLEVGQAGVFTCNWQGSYTHQGGYAEDTVVASWATVDQCEVAALGNLVKGMYANVTVVSAPAGTYTVRIRDITGSGPYTIDFEPTGMPAGITGEAAPVPTLEAIIPGATTEPDGAWLKFLNGRVWIEDGYKDVRAVNWNIALNPAMVPTPNNNVGVCNMVMGEPEVTCEIEYSAYDDGIQFQNFQDRTQFSVITVLGDGTPGNAVAIYCPRMHNADAPVPGEADNLTTLNTTLRAGLYDGDDDPYDGVAPSNTICRWFFAW